MSAELNARREASYIKHIAIAVASDDSSAPFRTFFDNWFAYNAQGPFLNSKGRPRWFNKADPVRSAAALKSMHYVSDRAFRILIGEAPQEELIKDHTVPVAVLRDHLLSNKIIDEDRIRTFLLKFYRLGVLTVEDDKLINREKGLRSGVGAAALHEGYDPIARYNLCKITAYNCSNKFSISNG